MKKVILNSIMILAALYLLSCGDPTKPPSDGALRVQPAEQSIGNLNNVASTVYIFWEVYSYDADDNPLNGIEIQVDNINAVGQASDEDGNLSDFGSGASIQFLDSSNSPVTAPFKFNTDGRGYYRLGALIYLEAVGDQDTDVTSDTTFSAAAYEMYVTVPFTWLAMDTAAATEKLDVPSYSEIVDPADFGIELAED
jgi:hypothetical protein